MNDVMHPKMRGKKRNETMLNMKYEPKPFLTLPPKQVLRWQQQLASWHLHLWENNTELWSFIFINKQVPLNNENLSDNKRDNTKK